MPPQKRIECFRLLLEHLAWIEHQFLSGIRDSRKAGSLWGMMRGVGGVRKSIHQSWLAKGLGLRLGLLCWGFKGVQEEIPSEEASTLQIGSGTFAYSLSSEAVVMKRLRRWKRLWRRGLPWSLPDVAGTVQRVYCSRRRVLRMGLEFHVCTTNKSAHTKKSLKTYLMILVLGNIVSLNGCNRSK